MLIRGAEKKSAVKAYQVRTGSRIEAGGTLSSDTYWQADTVTVTDSLTIPDGLTLKIKPGVRVEFAGYYPLLVQGQLLAAGKADSLITFTSADPAGYATDSSVVGAWHGIRFEKTLSTNDSSLLRFCRIEYAKAVTGKSFADRCGGAVYLENFSKLRIENCFLNNNTAFYGGAVYNFFNSNIEIVGSLITGNQALEVGAAVLNFHSYPKIFNNTITENAIQNTSPDIYNAAVFNFHSKPHFYNNIVRDNQLYTHGQLVHHKYYYTGNNNLQGDSLINKNIDEDPLYSFQAGGDYSLTEFSPCVDNGRNDPPYAALPELDLSGNPRAYNEQVDIGAYEYAVSGIVSNLPVNSDLKLNSYPNPFNPATTVLFQLDRAEKLSMAVYNLKGEQVQSMGNLEYAAGKHSVSLSLNGQASGVYFLQIKGDCVKSYLKLMLVR